MQQRNHEYVQALEMERTKMVVFERELPLSIELVSRAIESYKQQVDVGGRTAQQHRSDTSEDTTADDCEPLLELIPIKNPTASETSSESEDHPLDSEKSDWLRSVQLWNQTPDLPPKPENEPSKEESGAGKKGSKSVNKKKSMEQSHEHHATESSSTENKEEPEKSGRSKKEGSSERKQRRCWSQELHRRFTQSLQQLGGAHVATPKQIRDLMKVDGLTNDEVKSHLQKYRLHTRRPSQPPNQSTGSNTQAHQFVVVGGIWVTSSDYPTMPLTMAANREANGGSGCPRIGVYTPMAAPEPQPHQWQQFNPKPQIKSSKNSEGQGDALARCISPSMSSTTRTAPSPIY